MALMVIFEFGRISHVHSLQRTYLSRPLIQTFMLKCNVFKCNFGVHQNMYRALVHEIS